jgi:hypothetical protein
MPYGGMGMGVGLTTMAMFIATPQLDMPDRNEGFVVPEGHLLTCALPSPNFDMQRLLLAPSDAMFDSSVNCTDSSGPSAGNGGVWAQAAEAACARADGTNLPSMVLSAAPTVHNHAASATYAMLFENAATTPTGPTSLATAVNAVAPVSVDADVTQVALIVSPAGTAPADARVAVNATSSVVIYDHVVESKWAADRIVFLDFDAEALQGLPSGAIVLQMSPDETDTRADGNTADGNTVVPTEGALTLAWPTFAPDVVANIGAPLMRLETYVLADTLLELVTLQDDTANVVVYLGGSVSVVGFEFRRDRIALVEDAPGHNR